MMAAPRGSSGGRIVLAACAVLLFCVFAALGTWQVKRLQWKLDLIDRVNSRVNAPPVPAPGPEQWARVTAASDEYRRVRVSGKFLYPYTTRVQTTTAKGIGFWLMTPLCTDQGIVFVNRGFVPMRSGDLDKPAPPVANGDACAVLGSDPAGRTPAVATVTGLLRLPEPKGRLLRENDPAHDRWYVRDIPAIAAKRGLRNVAPYFVDAPAGQEFPMDASEQPVGGLTVIAFPNNHLVYALTWFTLAAMVAGGYYLVLRHEQRKTRTHDQANHARDD